MNFITPPFSNNELLSMLPSDELILLRPLLTKVQLVKGQILHEAGERIEQMFFVQQGFVLMVAEADGNKPSNEVGLIGREGMVGLPVLLHPQAVSFNRTMVQVPGAAHRLPAQVLHEYAYALPVLRRHAAQDRRGHSGAAGRDPSDLPGPGGPTAQVRLQGLRGGGGAGPCAGAADRGRPAH